MTHTSPVQQPNHRPPACEREIFPPEGAQTSPFAQPAAQSPARRPRRSEDVDPARGSLDLFFAHGSTSRTGLPAGLTYSGGKKSRARARASASGHAIAGFFKGLLIGPRDGLRRVDEEFRWEQDHRGSLGLKIALRPVFKVMAVAHGVITGPFATARKDARRAYRLHLRPDFAQPTSTGSGATSERRGGHDRAGLAET